jgi:hypothetical protein
LSVQAWFPTTRSLAVVEAAVSVVAASTGVEASTAVARVPLTSEAAELMAGDTQGARWLPEGFTVVRPIAVPIEVRPMVPIEVLPTVRQRSEPRR